MNTVSLPTSRWRSSSDPLLVVSLAVGLTLAAAMPSRAGELELRFRRIVGTGDAMPGAPAGTTFSWAVGGQPAGSYVAFWGGGGGIQGYYVHDGTQAHRIYDSTMLGELPGLPPLPLHVYFDSLFAEVHVSETGLAAATITTSDPDDIAAFRALYGWHNGSLFLISAKGDPAPGGPPGAILLGPGTPRVRGNEVYFLALRSGADTDVGYYRWRDGSLEEITFADLYFTSPIPTPTGVCAVAVDPNPVGHPAGIWCREDGATEHELVFDLGQPFPGGTGHWQGVPNSRMHRLDDGLLRAARSSTNDASGLYRFWHDWVEPVLTNTDVDPITGDPFTLWWMYSGAGQRVAFTGYDPADFRLRLRLQDEDRSFHKLVDEGDMFEGQTVGLINLHFGAFSGDRLAFTLARSNDWAVWVADFGPDPGPGPGDGPSVLEIPTLGSAARAILLLLLVLSGAWALRRPRRG